MKGWTEEGPVLWTHGLSRGHKEDLPRSLLLHQPPPWGRCCDWRASKSRNHPTGGCLGCDWHGPKESFLPPAQVHSTPHCAGRAHGSQSANQCWLLSPLSARKLPPSPHPPPLPAKGSLLTFQVHSAHPAGTLPAYQQGYSLCMDMEWSPRYPDRIREQKQVQNSILYYIIYYYIFKNEGKIRMCVCSCLCLA